MNFLLEIAWEMANNQKIRLSDTLFIDTVRNSETLIKQHVLYANRVLWELLFEYLFNLHPNMTKTKYVYPRINSVSQILSIKGMVDEV